MPWREVLERGGPQIRLGAGLVRAAQARLQEPPIPCGPLRLGSLTVTAHGPRSVRVAAYSSTDPIDVPRDLFDALPRFQGRTAAEALEAIEREDGLAIEPAVVGHLVDHAVLMAAPDPARAPDGSGAAEP
jgi:hypothetical protein